jgi:hypothetical protein
MARSVILLLGEHFIKSTHTSVTMSGCMRAALPTAEVRALPQLLTALRPFLAPADRCFAADEPEFVTL